MIERQVALTIAVIFFCLFLILIPFPIIGFIGAPYYPSARKRVKKMIDLAKLKKSDVVVDLGSGDGRIVEEAAKIEGVEAHGVELNPFLALFTRIKFRGKKNIKIMNKSMWNVDLRGYTRIFLFCLPKEMQKFEKKLKNELKPGTLIISNIFTFTHWKPIKKEDSVYVYKV
jgi:cyclopropane fatty-acyl-phospholipid synthase-like methyltransferase